MHNRVLLLKNAIIIPPWVFRLCGFLCSENPSSSYTFPEPERKNNSLKGIYGKPMGKLAYSLPLWYNDASVQPIENRECALFR